MAYADYTQLDAYQSKVSGSHVEIRLYRADQTKPMISQSAGINVSDAYEVLQVEEAGDEKVEETVIGRHNGSGSLEAFWTAERNDALHTPENFLAVENEFTLQEVIARGRPGAGTVVNCYTGVYLSNISHSHGARGLKNMSFQFVYETHYNGLQWSAVQP